MIDEKKFFERLRKLEARHRPSFEESEKADPKSVSYEVGFADGVNQAMNEITALLDEIRLNK